MTCTDFIKNQKEDFFYNLVDENFVSMADTEGLYAFMLNWITQLCTVRLLKSQTKKVFGRINEVHPKNVIYVEHWLMRALQNDKTCIHAYNALAQRINRKSEGILPYPVKAVNESELLELIQCEQKPEAIAVHEYSPIFRLDPKLMEEIFEHCEDIIDCEQEVFFQAIETADFSELEIKTKYKVQHLVYKLSSKMGKEWYEKTIASMGWTKSECSGHGSRLDTKYWAKRLNKILKP